MRLRAALVATIVAVAAVAGTVPASGQVSSQAIVSVPSNGSGTNYPTPVVVAEPGAEVTFVNFDLALHDVISHQFGPDGQPWCTGDSPRPEGECPLFWTPLIPGLGRTIPVSGLENLESGQTYTFYCSIHSWMEGTLIAL